MPDHCLILFILLREEPENFLQKRKGHGLQL